MTSPFASRLLVSPAGDRAQAQYEEGLRALARGPVAVATPTSPAPDPRVALRAAVAAKLGLAPTASNEEILTAFDAADARAKAARALKAAEDAVAARHRADEALAEIAWGV